MLVNNAGKPAQAGGLPVAPAAERVPLEVILSDLVGALDNVHAILRTTAIRLQGLQGLHGLAERVSSPVPVKPRPGSQ